MARLETYTPPDIKKKPEQQETMGQRVIRMGLDFLSQQIKKGRNAPTPGVDMISIENHERDRRNAEVMKKTGGTKENPYNLPMYEEPKKTV